MDDYVDSQSLSTDVQSAFNEEYGPAGLGYDDVRLLSRFVLGVVLIASQEALRRLRAYDQEAKASDDQLDWSDSLDDETAPGLVRYLALGMFAHGQRWAFRGAQNGLMLSLATAQWAAERLEPLTASRFMRPIRGPVESRIRRLGNRLTTYMRTGKREEVEGKLLVNRATIGIVDELVEYMAQSPEVTALARDIVGGQGASMAGVVVDHSRQVSAAADTAAERVVRKLLRLRPRKDLPLSPLAGHAQTMYELDPGLEGEASHDE